MRTEPIKLVELPDTRSSLGGYLEYVTRISDSNVGAAATGPGATASGYALSGTQEAPTEKHHREAITEAQLALVRDQDALRALDSNLFEALGQFLRLARDIQVEQRSLREVQVHMKDTLDEVWAKHAAAGLASQRLPGTLQVVSAIASNPIMAEVAKKLISG